MADSSPGDSSPGAFLGGLQDGAHDDEVFRERDLEFYWDSTNSVLKHKVKYQGATYQGGTTASATELDTLDGILATTDELNRIADVSTRLVAAGGTLAATVLISRLMSGPCGDSCLSRLARTSLTRLPAPSSPIRGGATVPPRYRS